MKWSAQRRVPVVEGAAGAESLIELLRRATRRPISGGLLEALDALRAPEVPTVIVLDDVAALGANDRDRLAAIGRALAVNAETLLILGGADFVDGPAVERIALAPLDEAAVIAWACPPLGRAGALALHRRSGGFPAHVQHLLARIAAGTLRERDLDTAGLERRVARTARGPERAALAAIAALERASDEALEALGLDLDALAQLQASGWIERADRSWRLVCGGDADDVLAAVEPARRRALHRAIADLLAARGDDPAARVRHRALGGDASAAREELIAAESAWSLAPRDWRRTAEALIAVDPSPPVRIAAARIHDLAGQPDQALALLSSVEGDDPDLWRARGACLLRLGRASEAIEALRAAAAKNPESIETRDLLARALLQRGEYTEAEAVARDALSNADGGEAIAGSLHESVGLAASYLGRAADAREHLAQAARAVERTGAPRDRVRVASYRAIASFRAGDLDAAIGGYRDAFDIADQHGLIDQLASAALNLGTGLQQRGELGPALDAYERGMHAAAVLAKRSTELWLIFNLANLHAQIGVFDRAQEGCERALAGALEQRLGTLETAALTLRGELHRWRGDPEGAARSLLVARDQLEKRGATHEIAEVDLELAAIALAENDVAAARARLPAVDDTTADLRARRALLEGKIAAARADLGRALHALEQALTVARTSRNPSLEIECRVALAEACANHGAPELARDHRRAARALAERVAASLPAALREPYWQHPSRRMLAAETEATSSSGLDLARFLEVNKQLNSALTTDQVLAAAIDAAIALSGAERGFVLLREERSLRVAVARNLDRERIGRSHVKFSRSIAERVIASGEPVMTVDARDDSRFRAHRSVHALQLISVMSVPIVSPDGLEGALYLDNRFQRGRFRREDIPLLMAFADQVAIALRNARLRAKLEQRTRELEDERRRVQRLLDERTLERDRLQQEVEAKQASLELRYDYRQIIGRSAAMRRVLAVLDRVIESPLSVLIHGESGTGKELIARAIHVHSARKAGPFVAVNCAALPDSLLEAELFGHVRGAFTGAHRDREGLFVAANFGTIFLDEIGETSLAMQAKLLRVLQEREVQRIGASAVTSIDVRIVAATNRDLRAEVDAGRFREDLYYRLGVVVIDVPPLRERREDIPEIARALVARLAPQLGKPVPTLDRSALRALLAHRWPGNVRELENALARALMLIDEPVLRASHLDLAGAAPPKKALDRAAFEQAEARRIIDALNAHRWNMSKVARELGIPRNTLYRKLRRHGLIRPDSLT